MSIMLEAMRKAGLISDEKAKSVKKKRKRGKRNEWKKNRFGDMAIFEIWEKTRTTPKNYLSRCGLCGKYPSDSAPWESPRGTRYNICGECFSAESRLRARTR